MENPIRNVDVEGCMSLLDPEGHLKKYCVVCDLHERADDGTRCRNCPFIKASAEKAGKKTRVACGAKFKQFGITWECGIYNFFFFVYHPHLNWQLPEIPAADLLGNFDRSGFLSEGKESHQLKKFIWHIHHLDGNRCNNNFWNLLLVLSTEHGCFHGRGNGEDNILAVSQNFINEIRRRTP